ncbi:hypothetical protein [Umezawaea sp. Da 62-37]|uniref:hypothetical protein n=1 Tax=Umezawaea sp. Da 62-37 TaxID=3075927 RepID=UPI0028F6E35A|nr:hypothetical protein [Umezawaea sp. Da 62-37]WNV82339.1 hypothetical protein RM788_29520 [Umezawaea sp. Da 62-37]
MKIIAAAVVLAAALPIPAVAAGQPAEGCASWQRQVTRAPPPNGGTFIAASPNGRYFAMWVDRAETNILHADGVPTELPKSAGTIEGGIGDINDSGAAVGHRWVPEEDGALVSHAYVYRDGHFDFLPDVDGRYVLPVGINEAGDVVGTVNDLVSPEQTVVWPANAAGTYRVVGDGKAVGIDETGAVVTSEGVIHFPDGTSRAAPAGVTPEIFQAGRIVGTATDSPDQLVQWDAEWRVVRRYPGVSQAIGINSDDRLLAFAPPSRMRYAEVWRGGERLGFPGASAARSVNGITEDGVVFGGWGSFSAPPAATWTCVPL